MKPTRRGVALLIVLAALILSATATALLVTQAATIQAQRRVDRCCLLADDLLKSADGPIGNWLSHDADEVVLSDKALSPKVGVLSDCWVDRDTEYQIQITAFDQCGMVPFSIARSGSP